MGGPYEVPGGRSGASSCLQRVACRDVCPEKFRERRQAVQPVQPSIFSAVVKRPWKRQKGSSRGSGGEQKEARACRQRIACAAHSASHSCDGDSGRARRSKGGGERAQRGFQLCFHVLLLGTPALFFVRCSALLRRLSGGGGDLEAVVAAGRSAHVGLSLVARERQSERKRREKERRRNVRLSCVISLSFSLCQP